jgi:methionyl-tRNA formyltransferase
VPSLKALHEAGHKLELVVTQPDRPGHRMRPASPAVKVAAQELGLEVFQPDRIRQPESVERLRRIGPELIVVAAYGQIVPASVLEIPSRGSINVHASLLPRWRGAAPVARALLSGDALTGVTIMLMDDQLDHGPILAQAEVPIEPGECTPTLTDRLARRGADLLLETLQRLDTIEPREQDHAAATYAGKLSRQEGELDWEMDAVAIDRRVRAFQPWPGVTLPFAGTRVKVLRGQALAGSGPAGQVLSASSAGVEVACGGGSYLLEEVQLPTRRPVHPRTLLTDDA